MTSLDPALVVWYVTRGPKMGPMQLRFLRVAKKTPAFVYLQRSFAGHVRFTRESLNDHGVYETPAEALANWVERSKRWADHAKEELRLAEHDLAIIASTPLSRLVGRAKEGKW